MLNQKQKTVLDKLDLLSLDLTKNNEKNEFIVNFYSTIKILLETKSSYNTILDFLKKNETEIINFEKNKNLCKIKSQYGFFEEHNFIVGKKFLFKQFF